MEDYLQSSQILIGRLEQGSAATIALCLAFSPIGVNLRPVNAHNTNLCNIQLLGQKQNLQETLGNRRKALAPKGRDRVMVETGDGDHKAHTGIAVRRALDRPDHEVRQIILRDPIPKIRRKQKSRVPRAVHKFTRGQILTEIHPKVRQPAK